MEPIRMIYIEIGFKLLSDNQWKDVKNISENLIGGPLKNIRDYKKILSSNIPVNDSSEQVAKKLILLYQKLQSFESCFQIYNTIED